ncbi:MAG: NAD(P)-binding domain-containing protein [Pyrinomonadaceae bacterium]
MYDLIIIGAGPAGIAAAYEAKQVGLDYLVIEKGLIGNTIYNYPVGLTVFSTTNELEFEPGGLKPAREKPTREELLSYYVRFVLDNKLNVKTEETVAHVTKSPPPYQGSVTVTTPFVGADGVVCRQINREGSSTKYHPAATAAPHLRKEGSSFLVTTDKDEYQTKNVLFAIGAMDFPRKLNVPGEDLPHVYDHFRETYPWVRKRALIVGGGNSAGEAALFLAQEGAEATLAIFRGDWENNDPKQGCIKYWVKQPLEEELKEHCLRLFFLGKVIKIREGEVELESETGERVILPNDVVFVLIGSDADLTMMKDLGVATENGKYGEVPVHDPETFETTVPGVYVAGHFTNQRHIKGAIDAAKAVVRENHLR